MHTKLRHTTKGSFWEQAVRTELNCTLPIEVTHHGKDEFNAELVKMLEVRSPLALLAMSSASLSPLSPGTDAAALRCVVLCYCNWCNRNEDLKNTDSSYYVHNRGTGMTALS